MHRFGETERLYQPIGMPSLVRSASAEPFSQAARRDAARAATATTRFAHEAVDPCGHPSLEHPSGDGGHAFGEARRSRRGRRPTAALHACACAGHTHTKHGRKRTQLSPFASGRSSALS